MESHHQNNFDVQQARTTNPTEHSDNQEGSATIFKWCEKFESFIENGKLQPIPLSVAPYDEPQEEESSHTEESKTKRKTVGKVKLHIRLFKYLNDAEEYLLEIHEDSGVFYRCHILVYERENKWNVEVGDPLRKDHIVTPMLHDPNPIKFQKKHNIPMEERLQGWTMEVRSRANGKDDRFYYRERKQFRSMREVIVFILYATTPKDLIPMNM